MLSEPRVSRTAENHYIVPQDFSADQYRKSFENALVGMSEGALCSHLSENLSIRLPAKHY